MPESQDHDARTANAHSRRAFLAAGAAIGAAAAGAPLASAEARVLKPRQKTYNISLAQWSLHKLLYANEIDNLDFAREAREMGFGGIEYVNSFFKDKAGDEAYLSEMNTRADNHGVRQLLIMVDGEGALGDADEKLRTKAIENHIKWLDAAKALGCHSIRVNAASSGSYEEQQNLAADGLRRLCEKADAYDLNVLVENHGGLSSNGAWLAGVMEKVDHTRCGTLPDFGNFCFDWSKRESTNAWYDRYRGVRELMPYAKAVSAKSHDFNEQGEEIHTDYPTMMLIVDDSGYDGWIGVEYEGGNHPPREGCRLTKVLLERCMDS